VTNTLTNNKGR